VHCNVQKKNKKKIRLIGDLFSFLRCHRATVALFLCVSSAFSYDSRSSSSAHTTAGSDKKEKKKNRWEVAQNRNTKKEERKLHRERVRSVVMHRRHFLALSLFLYHPF
jgi:hypothetical protein